MTCTDPEIGKLIFMYELKLLSGDERERFEDHLLSCEYCMDEVWRFSPVIAGMEKHREQILAELEREEAVETLPRPYIEKNLGLFVWLPSLFRPAPIGIAFAVAIVAFIALVSLYPRLNYSSLAEISREPFPSISFMGEADSLAGARLFSQGMAFYRNGNDSAAVHSLRQALRLDSTNAAALFYLGISCMQLGQLDAATAAFAKGLALNDSLYHERLLWYDGNARLARNDDVRALRRFEAIKVLNGKYSAHAEEKIRKIEQAQKDYSVRYLFQRLRDRFKSR